MLVQVMAFIAMAVLMLLAYAISPGTHGLLGAPFAGQVVSFVVFLCYMSIYVTGLADMGCIMSAGVSFVVVLVAQAFRWWLGSLLLRLL